MEKLIITACICGAEVTKEQNPAVPYTVEEIAREAKSAYDAGADIVTTIGMTNDETCRGVVRAAHERGKEAMADMIGGRDRSVFHGWGRGNEQRGAFAALRAESGNGNLGLRHLQFRRG